MKEPIKRTISLIVGLAMVAFAIIVLVNFAKEPINARDILFTEKKVDDMLSSESSKDSENANEQGYASYEKKSEHKENVYGTTQYEKGDYKYWLSDEELEELLGKDFQKKNQQYETSKPNENSANNSNISSFEVHFIDVGQGDCTLVRCMDKTLLIDGGDNSVGTKIQNYLQKNGVSKIDYLISTHGDADHSGGLDVVITKFDIGEILTCANVKNTKTENDVYDAISYKNYTYHNPNPLDSFYLADAYCQILGPVSYDTEDVNNSSIVVKVTYGNTSFMFMGDAGEEEEKSILSSVKTSFYADVLKLGHHGSNTSSSYEWLDAVSPKDAVVSCSLGNSYGHPHPSVLNYLRKHNINLYRTDEDGTLIAYSDGSNVTWNVPSSTTWKTGWDYQ